MCVLGGLMSFDADVISSEVDAVDWIGAMLITSGLVLIVFVLGQGPTAGWKTPCASRLLFWTTVHMLIHTRYNRLSDHRSNPAGLFRCLGVSFGEVRPWT